MVVTEEQAERRGGGGVAAETRGMLCSCAGSASHSLAGGCWQWDLYCERRGLLILIEGRGAAWKGVSSPAEASSSPEAVAGRQVEGQ